VDNYNTAWNEETVKAHTNTKHDFIYPAMLDTSDLQANVVELQNAQDIRKMSEKELRENYPDAFFDEENIEDFDWRDVRDRLAQQEEQGWESLRYEEYSRPQGGGYPPLVVIRKGENTYEMVDGNHRLDTWQEQGFAVVPAWVVDDYLFEEHTNRQEDNYSISTQSEIDRVQKAMDRLARSPSERISQYAALKERLAAALERNQPIMQSMRGDTLPQDFDRSRILNDLGFLDYILKVLPPEVRGRVGGYTNLAAIAPVDVYKGDQKVSEAKNPAGAIISAWMREGQNIGQAQKNTALPEGYSTVANTTDERRDKTVANFLIDRLKKIDRELERYYKRDLMERIFDVLDKSRPKAGQSGVKRSTLGAETQKFADMVYRSSLLDDEKTAERLTAIEAEITGIQPKTAVPKRLPKVRSASPNFPRSGQSSTLLAT
jgi:hypothetical protein